MRLRPLPAGWPRDPVLLRHLRTLDWPALLADRPGWSFDPKQAELRCEEGRPLALTTVRPGPSARDRTGIIFRRPTGGCEACGARQGCLHSDRPGASKHAEFSVPTKIATALRDRLAATRKEAASVAPPARPAVAEPVPLDVAPSLVLPARARQRARNLVAGASLRVEVTLPDAPPPRPRLLARSDADRQRRRLTWEENVARWALPDGAKVHTRVEGPQEPWTFLGDPGATTKNSGARAG